MIYLDHAATTAVTQEVVEAMLPYFTRYYGNAGSPYSLGVESKKALNHARRMIAKTFDAKPEEIYFTSGGSEADNLAIKGIAYAKKDKGRHIITSNIEHPAVFNTCKELEKEGFSITYLPVDAEGFIRTEDLKKAVRQDTILISIMFANNEIGTIQPIREIARIAHEHNILFHTDAVQAFGQIPISAKEDGFDMLSASAHKFHGPKGVGFLYVKGYQKLTAQINGGGQEKGIRAGTENIAGIVGMAKAAELANEKMSENIWKKVSLRNDLYRKLCDHFPVAASNNTTMPGNIRWNGYFDEEATNTFVENRHFASLYEYYQSRTEEKKRMPGNLNVSFLGQEAQQLVIHLDLQGVCVSGGSACATLERKPSHVIASLGNNPVAIKGAVRISIGEENTKEEIDRVLDILLQKCK